MRRQRIKAYGVIFTCLVTRAVSLDIALDLTTEGFLLAFRRFIALYGQPKYIRSDNGKNFCGAAVELRKMLKKWQLENEDNDKLKNFAVSIPLTYVGRLALHWVATIMEQ